MDGRGTRCCPIAGRMRNGDACEVSGGSDVVVAVTCACMSEQRRVCVIEARGWLDVAEKSEVVRLFCCDVGCLKMNVNKQGMNWGKVVK